ncbi:hypothetical protein AAVH_15171 [Aphelenchoides avenae]|nr:hypothetical protein AAVH_15171 [Aphelenchus avenae]
MNQPAAVPLLPSTPVNLPVEVSLQILGFLDRQTLGRASVANRRLSGIVNRHRKTLNLPEIPVPPRLSAFLLLLAFLAALMLVLLPFGVSYAEFSTRSRLRAAGLVPESFHDVKRDDVSVPCTTTCDSQLACHAECTFQYALLDEGKGTIMKRNCSSTGLPTTNASLATAIRWNCSFDYVVNEAAADIKASEMAFQWHWVMFTGLVLAMLHMAASVLLLRMDRTIADEYMAATQSRRRATEF